MNDRIFTADLVTTGPVHLGTGETGFATDLPLLRDACGRPYVPGTHVAGRLREIATRLAPALGWKTCVALEAAREADEPCGCEVCQAFGDRRPSEEGSGDDARASAVWCFDARPDDPAKVRTVIRDGVGIDRRTGSSAAEAGALYDAEWIPAGTAFRLRVEIEHGANEAAERVLAVALSEWKAGRGRIGGDAARGGGAFELRGEKFRQANLASHDGLMAVLGLETGQPPDDVVEDWLARRVLEVRQAAPAMPDPAAPWPAGAVGSFASLSFDLAFDGPLLVNDPAVALANAVSFAPVFAGSDWERPVLPGSSVRGVLRAQAERIARTVSARKTGALVEFAAACAACDPFRTREGDADDALRACSAVAESRERMTRQDLPFDDEARERCLACELFGSTRQGSRLWIADAPHEGSPSLRLRDFVAIDRFTGGALDGAKFDALPVYVPVFRVELLLWEPADWELGALALALRDVHDGLATLGAHGSRGFGRAEVRRVTLGVGRVGSRGPALPADDEPKCEPRESGVFAVDEWAGSDAVALAELAQRNGWAKEFVERCSHPRREAPAHPQLRDTYFGVTTEDGVRMEDLYPLTVNLDELEAAHAGS